MRLRIAVLLPETQALHARIIKLDFNELFRLGRRALAIRMHACIIDSCGNAILDCRQELRGYSR